MQYAVTCSLTTNEKSTLVTMRVKYHRNKYSIMKHFNFTNIDLGIAWHKTNILGVKGLHGISNLRI